MKAPTNVYGPGNEFCPKGEEIPAEWFDVLPDLRTHLDNVERAPDPTAPSPKRTLTTPDQMPARKADAPKTVKAKATVARKRSSS